MSPRILERPQHTVSRKAIDPDALKVLYRLKSGGYVAYMVGGGSDVIAGDLDGVRGGQSIFASPNKAAWERSVAVLRSVAPGARWLPGHGAIRPAIYDHRTER